MLSSRPSCTSACVITGAAGGIGLAITERYLAEGHTLFLLDKDPSRLPSAIRAHHDVICVAGDVGDDKVWQHMTSVIQERSLPLTRVIAAAGQLKVSQLHDDDSWHQTMNVNFHGVRKTAAHLLPLLGAAAKTKPYGHFVAISSIMADWAFPHYSAYSVSKAALNALIRSLAVEQARHNILVNAIAPAWVNTELAAQFFTDTGAALGKSPEALIERAIRTSPLRKMTSVSDIATMCAFLTSGQQTSITGQVLVMDNGLSCCTP